MSELKQKAIRGVRWTAFSAAILTVGGLVQTLLFPRLLAPEDFSMVAVINVLLGISTQMVDMGFSNAIIREERPTHAQLSSFYWVNVALGACLSLLVWVSAPWLASLFPKLEHATLVSLLRWTAPAFLLSGFGMQYNALLQKHLRFKALAVIEIAAFVVGFFTALWLASSGWGAMSLVAGAVGKVACSTLLLLGFGLREHVPGLHFSREALRPVWAFGAYQSMEKTIAYLSNNFDTLLITRMLSPEISGTYEVVKRLLIQPWYFINPVVTKVIYPVMARVQQDLPRLRNIALRGIQLVSAINIPIYVGCAIGAGLIVPVLFGERYISSGVLPFRLLALAYMIRAVFNPLGSVILAKGKGRLAFNMQLLVSLGLLASTRLGAAWGLVGTLTALLVANTMLIFVIHHWVSKPLLGATAQEVGAHVLPELLLSVLAFGAAFVLVGGLEGLGLPFVAYLSVGGSLYAVGLYFYRKNLVSDVRALLLR
jgi:O-antigen/teichoic acid export membrane protein